MTYEEVLSNSCVLCKKMQSNEGKNIRNEWLVRFASNAYEKTGRWKIGKYLLEVLSSNIQPSFKKKSALQRYLSQDIEDIYIFNETSVYLILCETCSYPDF